MAPASTRRVRIIGWTDDGEERTVRVNDDDELVVGMGDVQIGEVELGATSLAALESVTAELGATSLAALEHTFVTVEAALAAGDTNAYIANDVVSNSTGSTTLLAFSNLLRVIRHYVKAAGGSRSLYCLLEVLDAFTPSSGEKFTLTLIVDNN